MRHKLNILLMCLFTMALSEMNAQNYNSAIGAKLGYGLVGSYKKFLNEKSAIDLFAGLRWGGLAAGAYYELHYDIASVDRLQWYWGGGASVTTWTFAGLGLNEGYVELGVSGVVGLDYSFEDIPLNLSVDWAPTIVVWSTWNDVWGGYNPFRGGYGALTARYILN